MHRLEHERERGGKRETKRARGNQSITLGAAGQEGRACGGRRWGKSSKARGAGPLLPLLALYYQRQQHPPPPRIDHHLELLLLI